MEHLGIKNLTLTGCPSLYMNLTPELQIRKRVSDRPIKVAVNGSNNVLRHSFAPSSAASIERQLLETAVRKSYSYVLQNEFPEIDVALGNPLDNEAAQVAGSLQRVGSQLSSADYSTFLGEHGRVFFSVEAWSDFIEDVDFSIGTRFHGNMIALLSGVPAFIIPHDTRTLEMSRLMKIPHRTVTEIGTLDIRDLYDSVSYDEFTANYQILYRNYVEFLDTNNVRHRMAGTSLPSDPMVAHA